MNKYQIGLLAFIAITIGSCKLDPVVVPPGGSLGPNNGQTVIGITVNGSVINNIYLTGAWSVEYTSEQYYNAAGVVVSGTVAPNKFTSATLKEQGKSITYTGFSSTGNYLLALNDNVFYINLPADPFGRSTNSPVRITSLTSTSMTWVAVDTAWITLNGQQVHHAYQVIFAR